ncbi:MAG: ABC transporter permease, partial [Bryobacteraceae bacterium]
MQSVALAAQAPFSVASGTAQLTASKDPRDASRTLKVVAKETVGAGYFATLSERMLAGREFTERDQRIETSEDGSSADGSNMVPLPAVLNESAARGLFGNANAVGQRVSEDKQSYDVVGVVRDLKHGMADD